MSSRFVFWLALLSLPLVIGCEGCRRDAEESEEEEKQQQAPLEEFSSRPAQPFPADANVAGDGIKPGHWLTAAQSLKSNRVDARGQLRSSATLPPPPEPFEETAPMVPAESVTAVRPAVLPKGQQRRLDYRILAPAAAAIEGSRVLLSSRFVSSGRSLFYETGAQPLNRLESQEYFFVVLTSRPQRFAKFQVADWVRSYRDETSLTPRTNNYRLVFPDTDGLLPLSETMLDWTSTAVVLWDDLAAETLTPGQQKALSDWLYFGGTLVVNGAEAADAIERSALSDLLALRPTGHVELDTAAGESLLQNWAVTTDRSTSKQVALLRDRTARIAVDGTPADEARPLAGSADLVLLRRVGRGRVVQPRFDLTSDWLSTWQSFDSFINAAVLARPPRQFLEASGRFEEGVVRQQYAPLERFTATAAINTHLRIAARDARLPSLGLSADLDPVGDAAPPRSSAAAAERAGEDAELDEELAAANGAGGWEQSHIRIDPVSGIGGWSDQSDVIGLCRQLLRTESGIEIPDSSLVVRALGYYLLVLIPLNYLVFRLLGRLEYAWLAVPVIALLGAVWVARAARLDIGFARSQTELAVLEMQPAYQRGHLARVVAIYNSLSSTYHTTFESVDGAGAPVGALDPDEHDPEVTFRTGFSDGPELAGVAVGSNRIRMLHLEQIVDAGGPIELRDGQLWNQTDHDLLDAYVVEKSSGGEVQIAVLGDCISGERATLRFRSGVSVTVADDLPMQTANLIRRLAAPGAVPPGSARLIARIDASLPGVTITPEAKQSLSQTIVLAHLRHSPFAPPEPDVNLLSDLRNVRTGEERAAEERAEDEASENDSSENESPENGSPENAPPDRETATQPAPAETPREPQ